MNDSETFHSHDTSEVIEAKIPVIVLQAGCLLALLMLAAYYGYAMYRDRKSDQQFNARMDRLAAVADRRPQIDLLVTPMTGPAPEDVVP